MPDYLVYRQFHKDDGGVFATSLSEAKELQHDIASDIRDLPEDDDSKTVIIEQVRDHVQTIDAVRLWHDTFGVPNRDKPCLPEDRVQLRLRILEEEVAELRAAVEAGDMIETIDALTDIQYILDGTYLEFGMAHIKDEAFARVQASNMSKLGEDGKPIYREDGKVLKGPNFFKPDFSDLV